MKTFNLSIVIPNYNGEELLKKNLPFVLKAAKKSHLAFEIIVVDDGSKDQSISFLKKNYKNIKVFAFAENQGFVKTANFGISKAKFPFVLLLNNDIKPDLNFLNPLFEIFKKNKDIFAVSSCQKIELAPRVDEGEKESFLGGAALPFFRYGLLKHDNYFKYSANTRIDTNFTNLKKPLFSFYAGGGASLFLKEKFLKLGGFDPLFSPFYWEDVDLSYRAQKRGLKIICEPKSLVYHTHESTIRKNYSEFYINLVAFRNLFIFNWKNLTDFDLIISHLFFLPFNLIYRILKGNLTFLLGFFWALRFLPEIFQKRKEEKKLIKLKDKEVINLWKTKNLF